MSPSSRNCRPVPLPSSEGCGPQEHTQRRSNVRWKEGVGAWGRITRDSIGGLQGVRPHLTFFSFATAIDRGMASVNQPRCLDPGIENNHDVLISAQTSQNPTATFRNQHQHLEVSPNISNLVPTSRNQPAATSQNQPMGALKPSDNISKPTSTF
jgi:hypothetical protein